MAGRRVDMLGEENLNFIEDSAERITEVQGIGPKRVTAIQSARERVNPTGAAVTSFGRTLRVGDRVLQAVNDYDKGVFNPDLGLRGRGGWLCWRGTSKPLG